MRALGRDDPGTLHARHRAGVIGNPGEHLIAVLVVVMLAVIAASTYPTLKAQAGETASHTKIRAIMPLTEAYYLENGTYAAMTPAALQSTYDPELDISGYALRVALDGRGYCIQSASGESISHMNGPGGYIENGRCV